MKLKGSHYFYLFVVLLVGSVYYFDYYKGEENQKKKEQESILVQLPKAEVLRVEGKNAAGEFEIKKGEAGWSLVRPVQDVAAADEVDGWIQSLTTEKFTEKIGENEPFEWSTYGLDRPAGTLTIEGKSGVKIKIEISQKKNFEGNPFVRRNDEKVVYIGSSVWSSLAEKKGADLREKKILRRSLAELESVTISEGKKELKLVMSDGKWSAPSQPRWRLDQSKVRELVNLVNDMRASEFQLESDPSPAEAKDLGLASPTLKLIYGLKGNQSWIADFGQNKNKEWFAWPKDLKRVAKVDSTQVEKFLKANLIDLRDREEPFVFAKDEVQKVNVAGEKGLELSKEGESWKASLPGVVEESEVSQLLERLRQLRVAEFLDGKITAPGIENSKRRFILADKKGQSLLELRIGEAFKKKEDKAEKTFFYAKSSIYPDVIVLTEDDVKALTTEKLLKSESKAEAVKPGNEQINGGKSTEETKKQ